MAENSKIEWCDHTFNPWIGCTKVSPGCAQCYAEEMMDKRYGKAKWGPGQKRVRTSAANWKLPAKWNKHHGVLNNDYIINQRPKVFCASLADWLDDEVPAEWLSDLLTLIYRTPWLDWLLLTKRPENFMERLSLASARLCLQIGADRDAGTFVKIWLAGDAPTNVWIGTSVEDQQRADERIPKLLDIPAKIRFLSVEPLLGSVDLQWATYSGSGSISAMEGINWVIVGGESGPKARLCNVEWIRNIVRECSIARVPCFVKQLGSFVVQENRSQRRRWLLDDNKGGDPAEWTEDLRVRQFP